LYNSRNYQQLLPPEGPSPDGYVRHLAPKAEIFRQHTHEGEAQGVEQVEGGQGGQVAHIPPADNQVQDVHRGTEVEALLGSLHHLP